MKKIIYFLIDLFLLIAAVFYSAFKFKKVSGIAWEYNDYKKTILLGNGPSLKDDIEKVIEESKESEVYVLNYFAVTNYFLKIKPEYYVLTDRMFWSQNANEDIKKDNEELYFHLDKVDWRMNLICPESGFEWISNRLRANKNIKVLEVHSVNIEFKTEKINLFALNKNFITPHFINGLVMVLWHAIYKNSIDIEIYGADFSLFKEYYIDQKTNDLYTSASHFYKNTKAQDNASFKYPNETKKMLHTRLYQQWSSFYQMYLLSKIAKMKQIKITNLSSNSFLDSFERSK
tara:strand:+ start:25408 stop:26271 length:864 start_codon:yes stop_codon:yes gene_type:complete